MIANSIQSLGNESPKSSLLRSCTTSCRRCFAFCFTLSRARFLIAGWNGLLAINSVLFICRQSVHEQIQLLLDSVKLVGNGLLGLGEVDLDVCYGVTERVGGDQCVAYGSGWNTWKQHMRVLQIDLVSIRALADALLTVGIESVVGSEHALVVG